MIYFILFFGALGLAIIFISSHYVGKLEHVLFDQNKVTLSSPIARRA